MIETEPVDFSGEAEASIRAIRSAVFTAEQGVPPAVDFDGQDALASHVLARVDGEAAGTGRMLDDGHIGRIAVLPQFRGMGLGRSVMLALLEEAGHRTFPRVFLGSQNHAADFYAGLGFTHYGEEYMEAGIRHIAMELFLSGVGDT